MDFIELALKRKSVRQFSNKPIEQEKLDKLVYAGSLTPSACNSQPWKFIVVSRPELVSEIAKCGQVAGMNQFLDTATAFIIVVEEKAQLMPRIASLIDSQTYVKQDLGAAVYGITLEAASLDLGSCIIGSFNRPRIIELLELDPNTRLFSYIALGYPVDNSIVKKNRKDVKSISLQK